MMAEGDPKPPKMRREQEIRIITCSVKGVENAKNHRTDAYRTREVVLRRGFDFVVDFNLTEEFNPDQHNLEVHFWRGESPAFKRATKFVSVIGHRASRSYHWPGSVQKTHGEVVRVAVSIPVDCPVGLYSMEGEIRDTEGASSKYECPEKLAIIFNPWHEEDDVYMSSEQQRQEYVMNESGLIWAGAHNNTFTWPWEYDQFSSTSLLVAMHLLSLQEADSTARQSPVKVARTMAEMVNFNDDDGGILWGNWSDDYSGGTPPTAWSGSGAILEEFWRTKKVVKYAQCWVFGGTLTSVLRALGIPARPITNFASAHDTEANRSIDFYFDEKDRQLEDMSAGSIWNYHVWVEGWMERPDLKGGVYGGWQALDATPQELSPHSDTYTLGPAPVGAIKEGKDTRYDTEFVISEVNADVKYFVRSKKDSSFKLSGSNTRRVGKTISTKSVNSDAREDITHSYKHPEGSLEERATLESGGSVQPTHPPDVSFALRTRSDTVVGGEFSAEVVVKAAAAVAEARTVSLSMSVHSVSYIGALGEEVWSDRATVSVAPGKEVVLPIVISPGTYIPALKDQLLLSLGLFATVEETDYHFVDKETFRFKTPDVDIDFVEGTSKVPLGSIATVKALFVNPLPLNLTGVVWHVEGAGLTKPIRINGSDIPAHLSGAMDFSVRPTDGPARYRYLVVTCDSRELPAVMGRARVHVQF
nr:protein-glutamine gamma-glutamyltransferase K-like isoform X5 [Halisarca dujardinii]